MYGILIIRRMNFFDNKEKRCMRNKCSENRRRKKCINAIKLTVPAVKFEEDILV